VSGRVVVAGASGFMGSALVDSYRAEGREVVTIGRGGADAQWGSIDKLVRVIDGAALVINLAGKSVNCRYGPANRAEILRSRVDTTRELGVAIAASAHPPAAWFNSSTATIYRHSEDRAMTESTGELGEGFSVGVARAWEREFFDADTPDTRRIALRTAIVLGDGSALTPLLRLARLGLGGAHLDGPWFSGRDRRAAGAFHENRRTRGRQRFSWVHIDDVIGVIRFLEARTDLGGVINVASPKPSDDATVMRTIRHIVGAPIGLPMPRALLEVGSALIRTETELVLKSRWVLPERLLAAGYTFAFPELEPAIRNIVSARAPAS
jgi:NAD dependent epimerase/dehydratase family enzyme